jgi:NTP pyrophosphatase (non-canonical NTP hydrolase)
MNEITRPQFGNIEAFARFTKELWFSGNHNMADKSLDSQRSLTIMALGLGGEAGEVQEHIKKYIRDGKLDRDALIKELGDVIYYWARLCVFFDVSPSDVMDINATKLLDRKARGVLRGNGDNR